jgi:hypothetical protein
MSAQKLHDALKRKCDRVGMKPGDLHKWVTLEKKRLAAAREHPCDFGEYVMRNENTQRRVQVFAPHQIIAMHHMWDHRRSVHILPINHSKTFNDTTLALYMVGKYPNGRGAIVSRTANQAKKILNNVKHYIGHSAEFRKVFPTCMPGGKWTDSEITVIRGPGMKDPTCAAYGLDSHQKLGSRLDWIIVDDLLDEENTATQEQRNDVSKKLSDTVISRVEQHDWSRIIVSNSAWHPDDALHRLEKQGWATLRMQVDGSIYVKDDAMRDKPWDHPLLLPHPLDPGDVSFGEKLVTVGWQSGDMLWPNHPTIPSIEHLRGIHPMPQEFNRLYMAMCRDDGTAFCKSEWIEKAQAAGERMGHHTMVERSQSGNPRITGVDLAVSHEARSDDTCIFTFEVLPDGRRLVLNIEVGKMDGPQIVDAIANVHDRFNSIVAVESNAAQQFIVDFMRKRHKHVPVKSHNTGKNKSNPQHGVVTIFTEIAQGLWIFPHRSSLPTHPSIQRMINECLYYTPHKHTGDVLMAWWIAREQARKFGLLRSSADRGISSGAGMNMSMR